MFNPRLTPRWLVEEVKVNTTIQEVILVRTTLAWLTGIILLIATLMGVNFAPLLHFAPSNLIMLFSAFSLQWVLFFVTLDI